jgi:regulator of sigma E protease
MAIMDQEASWSNSPPQPVTLTIIRSGQEFQRKLLAVKPVQPADSTPMLGVLAWEEDTNGMLVHPTPWNQIQTSVGQIFATVSILFAHKSEVGVQQLGGAVMIIRAYSNFFESPDGWRWALWFSVILNVNLALINLLPLPVLDGGHILLSLLEAIRRRPLSVKILNSIQTGFAALIITFMLYIAFFDTSDWLRSVHDNQNVPVVFAPHK